MIDFLLIAGGLLFLFLGGEALLKGSVSFATNFGLSKLLVSAVIVGFGTSMPEMTVSVEAALQGSPEIALGNAVGSNIANVLLIVGLAALLKPICISGKSIRRDMLMVLAASLVLCAVALADFLNFLMGLVMLFALVVYLFYCYRQDRKNSIETLSHIQEDIGGNKELSTPYALLYCGVGLCLLIGGGYLLVEGAKALARDFGVSEDIIGLTIVAFGTSLPEVSTAIVASLKNHSDMILGNILGSNIFNILCVLSVTALIKPIPISPHILAFDLWVMLAVAILLAPFLWFGLRMGRFLGLTMLAMYCSYGAWLYLDATG